MKNSRKCPPCFSAQCGLCDVCCGRNTETHVATFGDCLAHAESLAKFSVDLPTQIESYRNKINTLIHRSKASEPIGAEVFTGIIPDRFKVGEGLLKRPSVYNRLKGPHGAICDTPRCKTMYTGSPEYFHTSWFPHIPVYTRSHDDGCQLCILCLKQHGTPVFPKL